MQAAICIQLWNPGPLISNLVRHQYNFNASTIKFLLEYLVRQFFLVARATDFFLPLLNLFWARITWEQDLLLTLLLQG
jgi:hypothetical protein